MDIQARDPFAFKKGDLVYGLADARIVYNDVFPNSDSTLKVSTIDQYSMTKYEIFFKDKLKLLMPKRKAQRSFMRQIRKSDSIKYKNILKAECLPNAVARAVCYKDSSVVIGRKAKIGLEWASTQKKRVHFVLDDIDMNDVVGKKMREDGSCSGFRPFTAKELRYLYRNKDNQALLSNVQFWNNKKPCDPPWEKDSHLWSQYAPKSWAEKTKADTIIESATASLHQL